MANQPKPKKKRRNRCSKNSRAKNRAKCKQKFITLAKARRWEAWRGRLANYHGVRAQTIGPQIGVNEETKLYADANFSQQTTDFYAGHLYDNQLVTVSEGENVSNPDGVKGGGKGVFADKDIPAHTRICPYVGKVQTHACDVSLECRYCMFLEEGYYICGRDEYYDLGYLTQVDKETWNGWKGMRTEQPCPPNYSRYINSLSEDQVDEGLSFNCSFELVDDGHDVMFIETTREIKQGEELLLDYGDSFVVV